MNFKSIKRVLIVSAILVLPCLFYLALMKGKNDYSRLEIFGPKEPASNAGVGTPDTIYHTISGFSFTDQEGRTVTNETFKDKIYVADFFFATCQTICPKMTQQMARVVHKFRNDSGIYFLSHTVNPDHDSVSVLKKYSEKYNVTSDRWRFVTGNKKEIYDLARHSYFITAMEGNGGPDDFIHSEQFALVDRQGRIRGYYDGTDPNDVDTLMDEIKVLKKEYEQLK